MNLTFEFNVQSLPDGAVGLALLAALCALPWFAGISREGAWWSSVGAVSGALTCTRTTPSSDPSTPPHLLLLPGLPKALSLQNHVSHVSNDD